MDLSTGFDQAIQNDQLIHGVMKRLHIFVTNKDYQDYLQEARIIFAETYQTYHLQKRDPDKFKVYVFQKLLWRMTDLLRQEQKYQSLHSLEQLDFARVEQVQFDEYFDGLEIDCLSDYEKELFYDCFVAEISLKTLANKYNCTARNLRYHRNLIKEKLRKRFS